MIVGLGADLFDVLRMEVELSRHGFDLTHIFAPAELEQCRSHRRPAEELAARFAAKEAVAKALAADGLAAPCWPDIQILARRDGRHGVSLRGCARDRAHALGVTRIHLSTTRAAGVAVACAVMEAAS